MIDIHTHVLPGMDDGAPDLATSTAMLAMARDDGITDLVATPHANLQYSFNPALRNSNLQLVREAAPNGPNLYPGCEVHLTPENMEALMRKPDAFTINGLNCVLLELPDPVLAMSVECAVQILLGHGVRPIIAHPERNRGLQRDAKLVARLVQLGCYLQLTAQSITGSFGAEAQNSAHRFLSAGMAHFIASDAHGIDHRRPVLSAAYREISRQYGEAEALLLFEINPRALLAGDPISALSQTPAHHSRFCLGDPTKMSLPSLKCPKCGSSSVRRSRSTMLDRVLAIFQLKALKCRHCKYRFRTRYHEPAVVDKKTSETQRSESKRRRRMARRREIQVYLCALGAFLFMLYVITRDRS